MILSAAAAAAGDDRISNPRYKTEICRNFKERSKCVYGDKCQFAHGRKDLRDVVRSSKYKTKLCQKYWNTGYCAYGPRCNFLHDEIDDDGMSEDEAYATKVQSGNIEMIAPGRTTEGESLNTMVDFLFPPENQS